jgi:hypothetical protein
MNTHKEAIDMNSSQLLPSNIMHPNKKFQSMLPFFCSLNMTISCGTTLYRAYNKNDITMIMFIIFVYFGSILLDYWSKLYKKLSLPDQYSSKGRKIKFATWVLLSSIMLGFACEFSTFMSFNESLCIFGIIILGNSLVFYVYFIWEGCKSCCSKGCSVHYSYCIDKNAQYKDQYEPLLGVKGLDIV